MVFIASLPCPAPEQLRDTLPPLKPAVDQKCHWLPDFRR